MAELVHCPGIDLGKLHFASKKPGRFEKQCLDFLVLQNVLFFLILPSDKCVRSPRSMVQDSNVRVSAGGTSYFNFA
jgi:hypothetical protein